MPEFVQLLEEINNGLDHRSVADPRFPRQGVSTPKVGEPGYCFGHFFHENLVNISYLKKLPKVSRTMNKYFSVVRNHVIHDDTIRNGHRIPHVKVKILIATEDQSLISDSKQIRGYTAIKDVFQQV